jgi:uncharacterized protein YaaR (DUF327 family)
LRDDTSHLAADVKPQEQIDIPKEVLEPQIIEENEESSVKDIFQTPTQPTDYNTIQILVPPHVAPEQLQLLRKSIYKERKVLANIQTPNTWNAYKDLIKQELTDPTFDLILAPSTWINSFSNW